MDVRAAAAKAPARERFGGARILSTVMAGLAGAGVAAVHLHGVPPPEGRDLVELHLVAAACAAWCGWRIVGLGLGSGPIRAARRGLAAAAAAAILFCLAAGARDIAVGLGRIRYADALALFERIVMRAVEHAEVLLQSAAVPAMAAAGLAVALLSEAMHRAWRWRDPRLA